MDDSILLYPQPVRIELNDKATKILFSRSAKSYANLMKGKKFGIIEKKHHKKKGELVSHYQLQNENGYTNIAPLGEYERDVLNVCNTEWQAGNRYITYSQIQRALSGKTGKDADKARTYKNQFAEITSAIDKLMCTLFDPEILEVYEELNYEGAEKILKAPILPCKRVLKVIGGKKIELVEFLDESPLAKQAKSKGQILTYDVSLLDVPNQNNTRLVIELKNYSLRRVVECIKHSRQMKPILTLDDIFEKCHIKDATKRTKQHARETLDTFFAHLQEKGFIKSYEWTKKGNKFYSIKFSF